MTQISAEFIYNTKSKVFWFIIVLAATKYQYEYGKVTAGKTTSPFNKRTSKNGPTKKICLELEQTLRARHKSCFLRPDIGPCRADIVQWYYDVKKQECYRFFWGGCQGNGNRFETKKECSEYCHLSPNGTKPTIPNFCSVAFDYGTCFGHYYRWSWDAVLKSCRRRLYSGCGGNQNNFHSLDECRATCVTPPPHTLKAHAEHLTTCVPINLEDLQIKL